MKKYNIGYYFLTVLVFLVAISYHPSFLEIRSEESNSAITPFIIITTLIVLFFSFKPSRFLKERFVKKYILSIVVTSFMGVIAFFIFSSYGLWGEARTILLPLLFLSIGYCLDLSEKQIIILCVIFGLVVSFSTLSQVLTNIGGFIIEERNYVESKNSLGALSASACVVSFFMAFHQLKNKALSLLFLSIGVFLVVLVVTIRTRTSMVCILTFFVVCILKFKLLKPKNLFLLLLIGVVFLIIEKTTSLFSIAYDYAYNSFTLNHDEDLTADRTRRNIEAWGIIQNSPIFGRMYSGEKVDWVHNYLLRIVSDYGVLGSFPLIYLYIVLAIYTFRNLRRIEINNFTCIGYMAMLVPLVSSLAEPTYPFGPGTAVFFSFFLFGVSLSQTSNTNKRFSLASNMN